MIQAQAAHFPSFAWAWPTGGRLLLLHAALNPDEAFARQALQDWLSAHDLDDARFPEHRLFAAITTRFGRSLDGLAEYPRLIGLQRLHWTQSRLAVAENLPPLQAMVDAGLKVVLLKGAARIAVDPTEQKSRTAFDLDLVLPDADFEQAITMLLSRGWKSTRGESALGLIARVSSVRARNFKHGRFGDIDLHRRAYQPAYASAQHDAALVNDAQPATYYGVPVFIPSVEERIVMAMGHGGFDGHHHSDWLVDVAGMLASETVDWDRLYAIARGRRLVGAVAIGLSLLSQALNLPISRDALTRFGADRPRAGLRALPMLVLARDTQTMTKPQTMLRSVIEGALKIRLTGRNKASDTRQTRIITRSARDPAQGAALTSYVVTADTAPRAGTWTLHAELALDMPPLRRRIELDINSPGRNLHHVQALHLRKRAGRSVVRFTVQLDVTADDFPISIVSLPSKFLEDGAQSPNYAKYKMVAFTPTRVTLAPRKGMS